MVHTVGLLCSCGMVGPSPEREQITAWINHAAVLRSPKTNEPMGAALRPNHALRSLIRDYCHRNGIVENQQHAS